MSSGAAIATAFVELRVDSDQAKSDARKVIEGIAKQQATMKVDADTTDAVRSVQTVIKTVGGETAEISVDATTDAARAKAKTIIGEISKEQAELTVTAEDRASSTLEHIQRNLEGLDGEQAKTYLLVEKGNAEANIKDIQAELKTLPSEARTKVLLENQAKFQADVRNINNELDKIPEKGKSVGQELTSNLTRFFSAAIFVGQIKDAIGAASELEQQVGGSEAVFKEAKGTIDAFAATAAEKVGLAESAFRQYSTSIGGQLKAAGFEIQDAADQTLKLVEVASDLSATYGGTTKEAVEALGAAFRGEGDSAERFNLQLSAAKIEAEGVRLGLVDAEGQVTAYGKAQATISLIMAQSKDAQGQFAAQIGTAGEQAQIASAKFENAKAALGANLLPIFSKAAQLAGDLASAFGALPGPVQTAIVAMAGIAIVAGPIKNVISSFQGLTTAIKGAAGTALLANPAFLAIATLATIVAKLGQEMGKTSLDIDGLSDSLKAGSAPIQAVSENLTALINEHAGLADVLRNAGTNTLEVAQAFTAGGKAAEDMGNRLHRAGETSDITLGEFEALNELIADYPSKFQAAAKDAEAFRQVTEDVGTTTGGAKSAVEGITGAFGEFAPTAQAGVGAVESIAGAFGAFAPSADAVRTSVEDAEQAIKDQNTALAATKSDMDLATEAANGFAAALDELFGSQTDLQGSADALEQNVTDLNAAILTGIAGTDGATLSLDNLTDSGRKNREQIRNNVDGIKTYITKLAESGATSDEVSTQYQGMRQQLVQQLTQFGLTEDQANDYINTLGLTPDTVETSIELQGQEAAKAQVTDYLNNSLDKIPPDKQTAIRAAIAQGDYNTAKTLIDDLTKPETKTIRITTQTTVAGGGQARFVSAAGRFVPGGSNIVSSLGEVGGYAGDEVVLPLGNLPRLRDLLAMPQVGGRVAAALGGDGSYVSMTGGSTTMTTNNWSIVAADPNAAIAEMQRQQWAAERANQLAEVSR